MEFKNPFWNRLFSSFSKESSKEQVQSDTEEQRVPEESQAGEGHLVTEEQPVPDAPPVVPRDVLSQLVLPLEHPFILLYELWTEENEDAPLPHLRLENLEDHSEEAMERELARLRKEITAAATSRLEEIPEKLEEDVQTVEEKTVPEGEDAGPSEALEEEGQEEPEVLPIAMDALPMMYVTSDSMAAWLVVFPPVGQGRPLDRSMLDEVIKKHNITYGLDTKLIDSCLLYTSPSPRD